MTIEEQYLGSDDLEMVELGLILLRANNMTEDNILSILDKVISPRYSAWFLNHRVEISSLSSYKMVIVDYSDCTDNKKP